MAAKATQILQLTPSSEIVFEGPFEHVVTSYLELRNPSEHRISFKVKTTAPRSYCVRPNNGIIEPDSSAKIAIMLQPLDTYDDPAERSKHKFMVQSAIVEGDGTGYGVESFWYRMSKTPHLIMDSKLRCVFQMPAIAEPTALTAEAANTKSNQTSTPATSKSNTTSPTASEPILNTTATSKPITTTLSTSKSITATQSDILDEKSIASSSSFLQPLGDDYKIVFVSLAMLFIGMILGKYII